MGDGHRDGHVDAGHAHLDLVPEAAGGAVATPLTIAHYLGHPGGAVYGYDQDRTESRLFRNSERDTHLTGLHLAGSWAGSGGFQPTLEAGHRVARRLLRAKAA